MIERIHLRLVISDFSVGRTHLTFRSRLACPRRFLACRGRRGRRGSQDVTNVSYAAEVVDKARGEECPKLGLLRAAGHGEHEGAMPIPKGDSMFGTSDAGRGQEWEVVLG